MKKILVFISTIFFASCNGQTDFNLEKILKNERRDLIVMEIDEYLNKKSDYGAKIDQLNSSQKTLLFVENLEREINNGGFNQFYVNSSGNFSQETVDALIKIGANKTAEIVKKANSEFPNGLVPKSRPERLEILQAIQEKADLVWKKCDNQFYEYNDDLAELLIKFVIENKKQFAE